MFEQLHKLASEGKCRLIMTVAAKGESLVVQVTPLPSEKDAPAALSQKLELEGTPAELDSELPNILNAYCSTRKSLQEALADAATVMQAATDDATKKTVAAIAKGATKSSPPAETGSGPAVPPVTTAGVADTQTIDLFK